MDVDDGDTTTSIETLIEAAEHIEAVQPDGDGDKGYHSSQSLVDLAAVGVRSYISERIGDDETGRSIQRRATPCIAIAGAFAASACYGSAARDWNAPLPISMRPAECAACISVATRTFGKRVLIHAGGFNRGGVEKKGQGRASAGCLSAAGVSELLCCDHSRTKTNN